MVLYQPEIPPNTGNISRLCAGTLSKLHLIEPLGFSISDKELKRAGLDYWHLVDLQTYPSYEAFCQSFKPIDRLWYLSSKVQRSYTSVSFQDGDALMFGPETRGLPAEIIDQYPNRCITIPMKGAIRSLNLSTAVGIVVYEALRQIGF